MAATFARMAPTAAAKLGKKGARAGGVALLHEVWLALPSTPTPTHAPKRLNTPKRAPTPSP